MTIPLVIKILGCLIIGAAFILLWGDMVRKRSEDRRESLKRDWDEELRMHSERLWVAEERRQDIIKRNKDREHDE